MGVTPEDVHDALLNLYAPASLAACALAAKLAQTAGVDDIVERAQLVRGHIIDCIELLRPSPQTPSSASATRAYDCLRLRYVSGFRVEEVARQLALSPRQVYRDLSWGEEQLACLLPSGRQGLPADPPHDTQTPLAQEIGLLASKPESVHLAEVLESALQLVQPLAQRRDTKLELGKVRRAAMVTATTAILRQTTTLLLSAILQVLETPQIRVEVTMEDAHAAVRFPIGPDTQLLQAGAFQAGLQLAANEGLQHSVEGDADGYALVLRVPLAKRHRVLLVEDNPGACALYRRYFAASDWDVLQAPHPRAAVDIAVAQQVDAVVLDLMMSDVDGWTVLRAMGQDPRAQCIPVVVCSVVNDPDLALVLGACAYLTKPVSRLDLLRAVRQVVHESRPATGGSDTRAAAGQSAPR